MPRWVIQEYTKQTGHGPETVTGHIVGAFGIEDEGPYWWVTHIPTGGCFLYSEWPTLDRAKEFCNRMMQRGKWQFTIDDAAARKEFNRAAKYTAEFMGARPRSCEMVTG